MSVDAGGLEWRGVDHSMSGTIDWGIWLPVIASVSGVAAICSVSLLVVCYCRVKADIGFGSSGQGPGRNQSTVAFSGVFGDSQPSAQRSMTAANRQSLRQSDTLGRAGHVEQNERELHDEDDYSPPTRTVQRQRPRHLDDDIDEYEQDSQRQYPPRIREPPNRIIVQNDGSHDVFV